MATHYGSRVTTNDGSTSAKAALSAAAIKALLPGAPDGVYWINLPSVGATQIFCLMDDRFAGGGWMLAMKATTGTTFAYSANYWTTANTLNPTDLTQMNGDAKYEVMNRFASKDMMARWPDITTSGGSIPGTGTWTWLENNFNDGNRIAPITFFSTAGTYSSGYGGKFIKNAKHYSGWANGIFSSQTDILFYGFNYINNPAYGLSAKMRWGFGWNENGEGLYSSPATLAIGGAPGSDDVSGGIGMDASFGSYSAGDRINCCQDTTGINRSARVEIYVR